MRDREAGSAITDKSKPKINTRDHDKNNHQPFNPEGAPPVSVGERLRQWARDHDWYQLGHIKNALALKRAFSKPVSAAVDGFLMQDFVQLALQVKGDFDLLVEVIKRFDKRCRKGFDEEDEWMACEHLRGQIHMSIDDLAALLDNRDLNDDGKAPVGTIATPQSSTSQPIAGFGQQELWVTFAKAAELLSVNKGTVSKWAKQNRFVDNGLKGQGRRLSKLSVLVAKQALEDRDIQNDVKDLRMDARRQAGRFSAL